MEKTEENKIIEEKPNISSNNAKEEINNSKDPPPSSPKIKTKLPHKYTFYFRISEEIIKNQFPKLNIDATEYKSQIKKISTFDTIEDFWAIYQHLKKPDNCNPGIEIQMFKDEIKPMWEDDLNKNGGKLTLNCNKGYTTIIWEEILLGIIGGVLPQEISEDINGIVFISKSKFNTLQIWFKEFNQNYCSELRQCIRDLIQIPKEVTIDIRKFLMMRIKMNLKEVIIIIIIKKKKMKKIIIIIIIQAIMDIRMITTKITKIKTNKIKIKK